MTLRTLSASLLIAALTMTSAALADKPTVETYRISTMNLSGIHLHGSAVFGLFQFDCTDAFIKEMNLNMAEDENADGKRDGIIDLSLVIQIDDKHVTLMPVKCPFTGSFPALCNKDAKAGHANRAVSYATDASGQFTYATTPAHMAMNLMGIKLEMDQASISWTPDATTGTISGKIEGYVSQKTAGRHKLPDWVAFAGEKTLAEILYTDELQAAPNGEAVWPFALEFSAKPVVVE